MLKEKYKKKYVELALTGKIPLIPQYLYEYNLPEDFDESIYIIGYTKEEERIVDFDIYLDDNNNLVLACNQTPAIFCYKPVLPEDCSCVKEV